MSPKASPDPRNDAPPDLENISLPPDHVLAHLTDAHCHPTDLSQTSSTYSSLSLGGIAAMATTADDQILVQALSKERGWNSPTGPSARKGRGTGAEGVKVVACFGYHPWFTHRYTLSPPDSLPTKRDHYTSLFLPPSKSASNDAEILNNLLPYLPDPVSFQPLLEQLRENLINSRNEGRLVMLGEVGLDGSARLRWPASAKHLHPDYSIRNPSQSEQYEEDENTNDGCSCTSSEKEEWKRLTPFKVPMAHQRNILEAQVDIAVELGINVSLHSVACAGPTYEALLGLKKKHGHNFTAKTNVDLHSAGGWSAPFFSQAAKQLPNLYASPSILITSRSPSAPSLIRSIPTNRILVESDSHDVRLTPRLVWAAAEWVSRCKDWLLEGRDLFPAVGADVKEQEEEKVRVEDWVIEEEGEEYDSKGKLVEQPVWTVRTLERNWARFMRLIDD